MMDFLTKNDGAMLTALFAVVVVLFYLILRVALKKDSPKWVRERIWRALPAYLLPLMLIVFLFGNLGIRQHLELPDHSDIILPLLSVGLAWLAGVFVRKTTGSRIGGLVVGLGCGFFSLMSSLPLGQAIHGALAHPAVSVKLGGTTITPYIILKTILTLTIFFMVTNSVLKSVEIYLRKRRGLKPSNRNLLLQCLRIILYTAIAMLTLRVLGVDLTTLTVFGGALGVGLGFGLQKITSNFVSGIILLLEQSVEEGDLIELSDGTLGFIRQNSARYTLVETFDSKEIMIPNEDFITNRVVNWTYSSASGRIQIEVGVSYKSDIELARKLIVEAAASHPLTIDDPPPTCYLAEFGDSSVNFLLHFWLADVTVGRFKPTDEVLTKIWHSFKEHGVEIPFPQRDVHVKHLPENVKLDANPGN